MSAAKIIESIKEAIDGNLARITIDGQTWERTDMAKRPVAWRVKDFGDGWIIYPDEAGATADAQHNGAQIQGLYVRNGL